MSSGRLAAKVCKILPLAPPTRLAWYKRLALLNAPSLDKSLALLAKRRLFLVTSTGRTGTTWLATLLNRIRDCHVVHEPVPIEQYAHVQALNNPDAARDYLIDFRVREMAWRLQHDSCNVYGEVNGALRRHIEALREVLPRARIIHLVRNPRDVIISMLNRLALTADDKVYSRLDHPVAIKREEWLSMDHFAKLCWLWASDNAYLRMHSDGLAYFEEITVDFASLREQILEPLGLTLDETIWREHQQVGRNSTLKRDVRNCDWTKQQEVTFEKIVAPELEYYSSYGGAPA